MPQPLCLHGAAVKEAGQAGRDPWSTTNRRETTGRGPLRHPQGPLLFRRGNTRLTLGLPERP